MSEGNPGLPPPNVPIPAALRQQANMEVIPLPIRGGPTLFLRRRASPTRDQDKPVLFLHGASAAGDTFLIPANGNVVDFLGQNGFDVWLLDWSGSFHVAGSQPQEANRSADEVAATDLPEALRFIWGIRLNTPGAAQKAISVVGHCMGAALLAMAIGGGSITANGHHVDNLLFSTIGLFYEVAWDGWAKVEDQVLERCRIQAPVLTVSPDVSGAPWPQPLEEVFALWPRTWSWGTRFTADFFRRLAFMFGEPFLAANLAPEVTPEAIRGQFGAIPFTFYRNCAQNVLRGFAAELDAEARLPAGTTNATMPSVLAARYLNGPRFAAGFGKITLMTGAQNALWHRDSIDRMDAWLRHAGVQAWKLVFDGFGHQDLWWGRTSRQIVFPRVQTALT